MDGDVLHACDWNYWRSSAAFFGTSLRGGTAESHDLVLWHCGFPQAEFNTAFLKRPGDGLEAAIAAAEHYFSDVKLPFAFECRSDLVDPCAEDLRAAGYWRKSETPSMVLASKRYAEGSHPDLYVTVVTSAEDLTLFHTTAFSG